MFPLALRRPRCDCAEQVRRPALFGRIGSQGLSEDAGIARDLRRWSGADPTRIDDPCLQRGSGQGRYLVNSSRCLCGPHAARLDPALGPPQPMSVSRPRKDPAFLP